MKTDLSTYPNDVAIFYVDKKEIHFKFKDEIFVIDLTEGDLEDSWNSIVTKDKEVFDTNFYMEDVRDEADMELTPMFALYKVINDQVDTSAYTSIKIVIQVGKLKNYFK